MSPLERAAQPVETLLDRVSPGHFWPVFNALGLSVGATVGDFVAAWRAIPSDRQLRLPAVGARRQAMIDAALEDGER